MTDDEARQRIAGLLPECSRDPHLDAALRHALQAIVDRHALVESWRGFLFFAADLRSNKWHPVDDAMHEARRHARGEP